MALRDELLDLLRTDPAFREEVRRQLLTEELLALPELVRELATAQRRTQEQLQRLSEQVRELTVQVQRQGEHLQQLTVQVGRQGEQILTLAEQVQALVSWQRGEAGRRDGERYEREILRQAPVLFNGGEGGSPEQPWLQQQLTRLLASVLSEDDLPAVANPFLADLIWWKGDQVAVVEVSLQVNGEDVGRAAQRAATVRRAGGTALAVVIGKEWAAVEATRQAEAQEVVWNVGRDVSMGFLAFRRLPHP